ncbi:DUF6080 domain-containing protein, partial [Prevotella sp.]|uniref:DUF6080 domain-containing protein n=1 Tax=Prevotella sp. TaxID=59823 RepID=UPI00307D62F6
MNNPIKEFKNILVQVFRMFRVRRNEALPAMMALLVYLCLNGLVIYHYAEKFMKPTKAFWSLFIKNFQISGFDPLTYYVRSTWTPAFNSYRHALLAFFVYPL